MYVRIHYQDERRIIAHIITLKTDKFVYWMKLSKSVGRLVYSLETEKEYLRNQFVKGESS